MKIQDIIESPIKPGSTVVLDKSYSYDETDTLGDILNSFENILQTTRYDSVKQTAQKNIVKLKRLINRYSSADTLAVVVEKEKRKKQLKTIQRRCSDIIEIYKKTVNLDDDTPELLYRGIGNVVAPVIFGRPHTQRKPVDSDTGIHEWINQVLKMNGFTARRDNSIFATSHSKIASSFGYDSSTGGENTYVIFPVNGFSYTWSPKGTDLVFNGRELGNAIDQKKQQPLLDLLDSSPRLLRIKRLLIYDESKDRKVIPMSEYNVQIINRAIRDELIPEEYIKYLDFKTVVSPDDLMQFYDFKNTDIETAINDKKEVYINGDYYGINTKHMDEVMEVIDP